MLEGQDTSHWTGYGLWPGSSVRRVERPLIDPYSPSLWALFVLKLLEEDSLSESIRSSFNRAFSVLRSDISPIPVNL